VTPHFLHYLLLLLSPPLLLLLQMLLGFCSCTWTAPW